MSRRPTEGVLTNMTKKIIVGLFLFVGVLGVGISFSDGPASGGLFHDTIQSSGTVFTNAGTVHEIFLSTGLNSTWVILYDTVAYVPDAGALFASFNSTQALTPQILFSSKSITAENTVADSMRPVVFGNGKGYRVQNGLYLYGNGNGNKATVYWSR